ncbi:Hsp70 family protein [Dactylosporangium sp. CA-092794]|uniref:Hsp70 family protein n=1 Tax=Dactylosporangium sp. CA-092794 TaxID=3239929 RepID=UPI003D8E54F4
MRLGVDFGTSHTVAVVSRPDGRTEALLFDSSPLLPSAVFADPGGALLTGRDAERSARLDPAAFEPHPKRRVDDAELFLGGRDLPVAALVEAVLRRVAEEAGRTLGRAPEATVLTHPAGWGPQRRRLLVGAAERAGLPGAGLMPEPVAAAMYFTGVLGHHVADGHAVVVYDFGGGTFDISVVRRAGERWEVVAAEGLDDVGGIDLDAAIVDWVGRQVGSAQGDPALWARLDRPETTPDRRHRRALWDDARSVKESLSRATTAGIAVPLFDVDLHLSRAEFENLARPWLERTVALTTATLFTSGVTADRLAGLFLVGGASRVPLVATLLHRALGLAPVILEQPELVVAHGSLLAPVVHDPAAVPSPAPAPPIVLSPAPVPAAPVPVTPVPPMPGPVVHPVPLPPPFPEPPEPAPAPPPIPFAEMPARHRRFPPWLFVPLGAVLVLGLLGIAAGDSPAAPPLQEGLFSPLTPKPVLVMIILLLVVASTGPRPMPATPFVPDAASYKALAPALVATAGAVVAVFLLGLLHAPSAVFRLADAPAYRLVGYTYYSAGAQWIFTGLAFLAVPGLIYLLARPPQTGAIEIPASEGRRRAWLGLWALAGAVLALGTVSPIAYPQFTFAADRAFDVAPLRGVLSTRGALTWWMALPLGLTLMIGAWLLVGAALRRWVAGHAGRRVAALSLALATAAFLLLNTVWERAYTNGDGSPITGVRRWYWYEIVAHRTIDTMPWWYLIAALAVIVGVGVPSIVRSCRSTY